MTVSVISSDDAKHDHKRVGGDDSNTNLQRRLTVRYRRNCSHLKSLPQFSERRRGLLCDKSLLNLVAAVTHIRCDTVTFRRSTRFSPNDIKELEVGEGKGTY